MLKLLSLTLHLLSDMHDQYALRSAMNDQLSWNVVPLPPDQDRKNFDNACDKWEQYQHQLQLDQAIAETQQPRRSRRHSQFLSEVATTVSHLPTIPDTITMRNENARPPMDFTEVPSGLQRTRSSRIDVMPGSSAATTSRNGPRALPKSRSQNNLLKEPEPELPEVIGDEIVHPSHLLCRTVRVFVAWKA